ncbi:hypothetical protein ABDJ41_11220 [Pedobacter sp. ASV1-7]|uniref:hypothetical protein n=1 Tax=Pedobacter sp. ASV1-7 TaxID=3145237 RepID=UPI0032E91330
MFIFILVLPPLVRANLSYPIGYNFQDEKKDKSKEQPIDNKKPDYKQEPNQPDIQKVPKARKQGRPPVVIKPKIKAKPKVIRPKIKRP